MGKATSATFLLLATGLLTAAVASRRDDADALIAGRQAAFKLSGADFGAMKAVIDAGGDVKTQAFAARALAGWGQALPGMFPKGSEGGKALPAIWSDRAGFEKAAATFSAEAGKLAEAAKSGDAPGFAAQWAVVKTSCGACHDKYREAEKPKG